MVHAKKVLLAFLIAAIAGIAAAQDLAAKKAGHAAIPAQPRKAHMKPKTYGTTPFSYYRMGASEFTGMNVPGADNWSDAFYSGTSIRRFATVTTGWFIGTPHLPSGAKISQVNIHNCVNEAGSMFGGVYSCDYVGSNCTSIGNLSSASGCGFDTIDVSAANYVVDNSPFGDQLVIFLGMENTDGSDSIAGASIEYQLTISPAPGVATFADVPTNHPRFQFVEALVAAGVTGGCGGGNFCPDAPLTRSQMAVFLSIALGLQWP